MTDTHSIITHKEGWLPPYFHHEHEEYIFLTSLNLGGAEKIVSDQLWANYYSKFPTRYTLIVLYEKEKEHPLPPNVQVIRLHGKMEHGNLIFQHIAFTHKVLVCHLINDTIAHHIFSQGVSMHLVMHNDIRAWSNSIELFEHPQLIGIICVCDYVQKQVQKHTQKPTYSIRHQIAYKHYQFNTQERDNIRRQLKLVDTDIVLGMVGRICEQKNYPLAIDTLFHLKESYPERSYKLVIAGGFEKKFTHVYLAMLDRINHYKLHNDVILLGFRKDIKSIVNAFDIALNTSYFEGLSMAIQELMGNGLPVVLSNVCGQPEIFDNLNQLNFFDLPTDCDTLNTIKYSYDDCPSIYKNLIISISDTIAALNQPSRFCFSSENNVKISRLCYGSHRLWSLFNHVRPTQGDKVAFLTSNLNLGGAQRSLTNLLTYIQENKNQLEYDLKNFNPSLILINQSNQTQFLNQLDNHKIPTYICQSSIDVFDIMKNMLNYLEQEQIGTIVFWNVESKIKLLLSKLVGHRIKMIDVSPGDYIFNEICNEIDFQDAIYYSHKDYYESIYRFVSKYSFTSSNELISYLKNTPEVIPNGVYINNFAIKRDFYKPGKAFKFLVCGRIAPSKHLEIILESFREVLLTHQVHLTIIGSVEDYYEDYYNELVTRYETLISANHIYFAGYHPDPQSVMKEYDSIIVLGTHQGSPNTVLEAGACNLPVIANDSGGTREIINDNTGILLPTIPETQALTIAMKEMIDNYETYIKLSHNCHQFIEKEFSMLTMAKKYLTLLK